jgi:hypothetical protein
MLGCRVDKFVAGSAIGQRVRGHRLLPVWGSRRAAEVLTLRQCSLVLASGSRLFLRAGLPMNSFDPLSNLGTQPRHGSTDFEISLLYTVSVEGRS